MKTNYGKLGQESMDSLKDTSKRSAEVQMKILAELMHRNRETVYGKKYGFEAIETVGEFQKKVLYQFWHHWGCKVSAAYGDRFKDPVYLCIWCSFWHGKRVLLGFARR